METAATLTDSSARPETLTGILGTDEALSLLQWKARGKKALSTSRWDGVPLGKREDLGSGRRITRELLEEMSGQPFKGRILGSGAFVQKRQILRELESKFPHPRNIRVIVVRVCRRFGLDPEELRKNTRAAKIADVRSAIGYLAVRLTGHNGVEARRQINLVAQGSALPPAGEK